MLKRWLTKKRAAVLMIPVLGGAGAWAGTALGARTSHRPAPVVRVGTSHHAAHTAVAGTSGQATPCNVPAPAGTYPTNGQGQTYGSAAGGAPAPDLVEAIGAGPNGGHVTGYVLNSQLDAVSGSPCEFSSPQAAVTFAQAHAGKVTTIPLYAKDGTTVVGQFTIVYPPATPPALPPGVTLPSP